MRQDNAPPELGARGAGARAGAREGHVRAAATQGLKRAHEQREELVAPFALERRVEAGRAHRAPERDLHGQERQRREGGVVAQGERVEDRRVRERAGLQRGDAGARQRGGRVGCGGDDGERVEWRRDADTAEG